MSRPFETNAEAWDALPETDRLVFEARELARGPPLRGGADAVRTGARGGAVGPGGAPGPGRAGAEVGPLRKRPRPRPARAPARHVRPRGQLSSPGNLYLALGRRADALDAFGWAARSVGFRAAARTRLAELALEAGDLAEVRRHAGLALDHDRVSIPAREVLAIAARVEGDETGARARMRAAASVELDPLNHFVLAETLSRRPRGRI